MAVTVTIEFTDEQWALLQEHHHCPVPKYNEAAVSYTHLTLPTKA